MKNFFQPVDCPCLDSQAILELGVSESFFLMIEGGGLVSKNTSRFRCLITISKHIWGINIKAAIYSPNEIRKFSRKHTLRHNPLSMHGSCPVLEGPKSRGVAGG